MRKILVSISTIFVSIFMHTSFVLAENQDESTQKVKQDYARMDHNSPAWISRAKEMQELLLREYPISNSLFAAYDEYIEFKTHGKNVPDSSEFQQLCDNEFDADLAQVVDLYNRWWGFIKCDDHSKNWAKFLSWYSLDRKNYSGAQYWVYYTPVYFEQFDGFLQYELGYGFHEYDDTFLSPIDNIAQTFESGRGNYTFMGGWGVYNPIWELAATFNMIIMNRVVGDDGMTKKWKETFDERLQIAGEIGDTYLFDGVRSRDDISAKVENFELGPAIINLYAQLGEQSSTKANIASAYHESIGTHTRASVEEKQFEDIYSSYYEVESCYLSRKDYAVQYVTKSQFDQASAGYSKKESELSLSKDQKSAIILKIEQSGASRRSMELIGGGNYSEERNSLCFIFMLGLTSQG